MKTINRPDDATHQCTFNELYYKEVDGVVYVYLYTNTGKWIESIGRSLDKCDHMEKL